MVNGKKFPVGLVCPDGARAPFFLRSLLPAVRKFLDFTIAIILVFFASTAIAAPIKIETKVFGKDVIFVFYRDNTQIVDLQTSNNNVYANVNIPVEYNLINKDIFDQYAGGIALNNNNQTIVFSLKDGLKFLSVIQGEKLDAIKFRSQQKKEEDLSVISSANNDPDAIEYSKSGDNHQLKFDLGNNDSKAAAFIRGKYLWIAFDQEKIFTFKEEAIFSSFAIVPSSAGTVLRIKLEDGYNNAKLERKSKGWTLSITPENTDEWKKDLELTPEPLLEEDGFVIKGNFSTHEIITFEDPEFGENIKVIPVSSAGSRVINSKESVEYSIFKTVQGVAIGFSSDDAVLEKMDDYVKVAADSSLDENIYVEANVFPGAIDEYLNLPTILPYIDKNLDILDFNERKAQLIFEASIAEEDEEGFKRNLELAKFFFIHEFYHESADTLSFMKQRYPNLFAQSFPARSLKAVSHTMTGEHNRASVEYDALMAYHDVRQIAELQIWNKYNEFSLGNNMRSIGFIPNMPYFLKLYSDDKYWPLAFAEIELALNANDLKLLEKLFKELRNPPEGVFANSLKYYKANYYRKKGQINLARQYLLDLTYKEDEDLLNSSRAEFDLIKLRVDQNDISKEEAIEALDSLRFKWRGDQLEYQILLQLASYYKDVGDIMNALRTYKYIRVSFSNRVSNFYVTSEMAKIFNEVFLPGGLGEKMDDFTLVALFFEFKELNPIGEKGDDIILDISKRLVKLDLLDNATDLLRHQIKFRLNGEKRVTVANNLAVILMMDGKPREAMLVLDETDNDNFNFQEYKYRLRLRAGSLIMLEEYDEALERIKDDDSKDAETLRRQILYRQSRWSDYADRVGNGFEDLVNRLGSDDSAKQDILRLAISYYMLGMNDQLDMILNRIGDRDTELSDTISLMSTSSIPVDIRNLEESLNIDQMQDLLSKYKNQFLDG